VSEHWTVKPIPQLNQDLKYEATVRGLSLSVERTAYSCTARVEGWLVGVHIFAFAHGPQGSSHNTVEDAQAAAITAAEQLYAVGMRGTKEEARQAAEGTTGEEG
jgi:hypothetical protein